MSDTSRGQRATLRILSTTDVHTHVLPYDYFSDRDAQGSSLATAAALIRSRRADADNCLLVDNGDFLQGTPLAEIAPGGGPSPGRHPAILAMNLLGYDAGTLGNHEFDFGLPTLEAALAGARFPFVLANVRRADGAPLMPPWTILERSLRLANGDEAPIRIGLIGFTPPQVETWDGSVLAGAIRAECILEAARREVPALRAAGADIVIALCHSGIAGAAPFPRMENAAVPLAGMDGIDALVTGHTHQTFPGPLIPATGYVDPERGTIHGKPAVMAGSNASHVGQIDLTLTRAGADAAWKVTGHSVSALRTDASAPPDPAIGSALAPHHARALARIRKPIGHSDTRIESYFALVAPSTSLQVLADAKRSFVTGAVAGLPDLPLLPVTAASRVGGWSGACDYVDIPVGPLLYGAAASLYPYPNTFCVVELNGAALRDWLERSASLFAQIPEGAVSAPLLLPNAAGYNFDVIHGLTHEIDLRAAPRFQADGVLLDEGASRIRDLRHEGRPVDDDQRFLVITNSFRISGGGRFRAARRAKVLFEFRRQTREIIAGYLNATPHLTVTPRRVWSFARYDRPATAMFETGPGALQLAVPEVGRGMRHIGPGAAGFERFEITL